jgi:hypothetical protein
MKKLIGLVLVMVSLTAFAVPVHATTAQLESNVDSKIIPIQDEVKSIESNPLSIVVDDNTVIYFASEEDMAKYQSGNFAARNGYGYTSTLEDQKDENMLWIGYHSYTPGWSKAISYTLGSGKTWTASGSYTYHNINISTGFSYNTSVAITYPANSAYWSRLGTYGDFTFKYWKNVENYYGMPTGYVYYTVTKTRHNHYTQTVYQ